MTLKVKSTRTNRDTDPNSVGTTYNGTRRDDEKKEGEGSGLWRVIRTDLTIIMQVRRFRLNCIESVTVDTGQKIKQQNSLCLNVVLPVYLCQNLSQLRPFIQF